MELRCGTVILFKCLLGANRYLVPSARRWWRDGAPALRQNRLTGHCGVDYTCNGE
jgi:hypothetical protein